MAACSSVEVISSSSGSTGGFSSSSLMNPIPDASADGAISGTRLKAQYEEFDDGAKIYYASWYDSQLQITCAMHLAADNKYRCLPDVYISSYFSDSNCMQKISYGCFNNKYGTEVGATDNACGKSGYHVYNLGLALNQANIYALSGDICIPIVPQSGYIYQTVGVEVPPDTFVAGLVKHDN